MSELRRISLDTALRRLTGGDHPDDAVAAGRCLKPPIGCGEYGPAFRDRDSYREWTVTGLCQTCQDKIEAAAREGEQ